MKHEKTMRKEEGEGEEGRTTKRKSIDLALFEESEGKWFLIVLKQHFILIDLSDNVSILEAQSTTSTTKLEIVSLIADKKREAVWKKKEKKRMTNLELLVGHEASSLRERDSKQLDL